MAQILCDETVKVGSCGYRLQVRVLTRYVPDGGDEEARPYDDQ